MKRIPQKGIPKQNPKKFQNNFREMNSKIESEKISEACSPKRFPGETFSSLPSGVSEKCRGHQKRFMAVKMASGRFAECLKSLLASDPTFRALYCRVNVASRGSTILWELRAWSCTSACSSIHYDASNAATPTLWEEAVCKRNLRSLALKLTLSPYKFCPPINKNRLLKFAPGNKVCNSSKNIWPYNRHTYLILYGNSSIDVRVIGKF